MARPASVVVWVCDNCGNYFGSSSAELLHDQWNEHHGVRTFRRSRCPTKTCAEQGIHRIPIKLELPRGRSR
jgi:hypothetical protein